MFRTLFKVLLALVVLLAIALTVASTWFPERLALAAATAERDAAGLQLKSTEIPGFHIAYLEGGAGAPLLLLHGFGADKDNWDRVARRLTPHFRVIAPDLPGYGDSSKPAEAQYGIAAQVENVHTFVQKLGLKQVHLGGSSMGGNIAAAYAARYPDEVGSLWLVAPGGVVTAQPSELGQVLASGQDNPLLAQKPEDFNRIIQFVMSDPPYIPGAILKVLGQRAAANYPLHQVIFTELVTHPYALEPRVQGLQTPTRILWGDHDRALSVSGAEILHQLMPHSSVTVMPGVGHLPMLERPEESAKDYLSFRESL